MRNLALIFALAMVLFLAACKPVQYTDSIECPDYQADHVHVWVYSEGEYIVAHPGVLDYELVNPTGCVVTRHPRGK